MPLKHLTLFIFENDVNVLSKSNKQKTFKKEISYFGILKFRIQ
jgi:hypothetical protein